MALTSRPCADRFPTRNPCVRGQIERQMSGSSASCHASTLDVPSGSGQLNSAIPPINSETFLAYDSQTDGSWSVSSTDGFVPNLQVRKAQVARCSLTRMHARSTLTRMHARSLTRMHTRTASSSYTLPIHTWQDNDSDEDTERRPAGPGLAHLAPYTTRSRACTRARRSRACTHACSRA